jgi:branched-chain amino acid aminotransferase
MKYPIHIERVTQSRAGTIKKEDIVFGRHYADHMFIADYFDGEWRNPRIIPFQNLSLNPATNSLHYGQLIFEGMKAYKGPNNEALLFRPDKNYDRFNRSATRMGMPELPEELFMNAIHELINIDRSWIPGGEGYSLYIRPFMMATDEFIGIRPTERFSFIIITSPAQPYYNKPVRVMTFEKFVRAFPGGVGYAKAAGNYGSSMLPLREAIQNGYDQVLWLDGDEHRYAEEIGSMNIFFMIDDILITPSLDQGTILEGVTRDSIIQLAQAEGIRVEERKISIDEVTEANKNSRLTDCFGVGTAASVVPISVIHYKGQDHVLSPVDDRIWYRKLKYQLDAIKTGKQADIFNWVIPVGSTIYN